MPELDFKGKEFVRNHHLTVPFRPLVPDPEKSVGEPDLSGNLIIHGDNLHALKALLPTYAGKVDCIFIDPPYNTGNEGWSYNDNVNSPLMRDWLSSNPVNVEDMLRHDKWCCMMWPRLKLMHDLLSETGSLWMTLDDNEAARAKTLLDEIFGEEGFIANIVWQKRYSRENRGAIGDAHDNVLVYSKAGDEYKHIRGLLKPNADQLKVYRNTHDGQDRKWRGIPMTAQGFRANQMYTIEGPDGRLHEPPAGRCWSMTEPEFIKLRESGRIWFGADGRAQPSVIRYEDEIAGFVPWTWWPHEDAGHTDEAKKEVYSLLGKDVQGLTPKPTRLLLRVLEIGAAPGSVVMDSFAGSGTTAHAVLKLNAQDGGNRKFILVECEDYADTVTAERVRRAIKGYPFRGNQREILLEKKITWTELKKGDRLRAEAENTKALYAGDWDEVKITVDDGVLKVIGERRVEETAPGLGGSFTYCTLGEPLDVDKMLEGKGLPSRENLAAWLLHVAGASSNLSHPLAGQAGALADRYIGTSAGVHYWLLYQPDPSYLQSDAPALTMTFAREIAALDPKGKHMVFSPMKHVGQKVLRENKLNVEHAAIPFSLFRLEID